MIILDTDILSIVLRDASESALRIRGKIAQLPPTLAIAVSVVTFHEQTSGWMLYLSKARTKSQLIFAYSMLDKHLNDFREIRTVPYDDAVADRFEQLRHEHPRIGTMDLRIAATALVAQATLITRNLRDFARIPGLLIEDWTKA